MATQAVWLAFSFREIDGDGIGDFQQIELHATRGTINLAIVPPDATGTGNAPPSYSDL